jgi:3-deoxy-D-manno-octulosonic-acid transferase
VPIGGHNLLEPAVLGLPVLSGPHTQNAQDVADLLQQRGALRLVRSKEELALRVADWFDDPEIARSDGARGLAAVAQSRGSVERLVAMIAPLLGGSEATSGAASGPGSSQPERDPRPVA